MSQKRRSGHRRFLAILTLLCLAGGAAWALQFRSDGKPAGPPRTAAVTRADFERSVLASGVVEARSLVAVGARVSGRIETLEVGIGDVVKAGDLIATIENSDQQNDLLRAQAALKELEAGAEAQRATIHRAELDLERIRALASRSVQTQASLDAAEADLAVARANLQATLARIDQQKLTVDDAQTALDRTRIVSPADGTVVAVVNDEGTTVNANQTTPTLVKIADLSSMTVTAAISEADVVAVAAGIPARFTLQGTGTRPFEAELALVEPAPASIRDSDTITGDSAIYYNALLYAPNPDGVLRIGMTAEVTIIVADSKGALAVPTAALGARKGPGRREVEVFDPATGTRETRVIGTGLESGAVTEVRSGLSEGEQVVLRETAAAQGGARQGSGAAGRSGIPGLGGRMPPRF